MKKSFIDKCLAGECAADDIDDFVKNWHNTDSDIKLHTAIGFTEQEYAEWVQNPSKLEEVIKIKSKKSNVALFSFYLALYLLGFFIYLILPIYLISLACIISSSFVPLYIWLTLGFLVFLKSILEEKEWKKDLKVNIWFLPIFVINGPLSIILFK